MTNVDFRTIATEIVLFCQNYGFSNSSINYVEGRLNDLFNNAAPAVVEGPAPVVAETDGAVVGVVLDSSGGDTVIPADDTTAAN
jgi:hypothetical protein